MPQSFTIAARTSRQMITRYLVAGLLLACGSLINVSAGNLDTIGWTALNTREPTLSGSGVTLAQVEAPESGGGWQPGPAAANQSPDLFTYFDSTNTYLSGGAAYNSALQSGHANTVASNYYDGSTGVARAPLAVEAFEVNYFINNVVVAELNINAEIVNQSYVFTGGEYPDTDKSFDGYAASKNTLFVNGLGNSTGAPPSPATMYNGIAVGLVTGASSIGPTSNGRCKPDIVAPSSATSYATPYVSGSAALLAQAGAGTVATDMRTLKALLLNGAEKPVNWTTLNDEPLDRKYGAGVLNVNRSHLQMSGGKHAPTQSLSIAEGSSTDPAGGVVDRLGSPIGWNFNTISTGTSGHGINEVNNNAVHNYHFTVTDATTYDITATLIWNRQDGATGIRNLDLKLYKDSSGTSTLVDESISTVDNVEHLYRKDLPSGDYVLQVTSLWADNGNSTETYALAFEFAEILPPSPPSTLVVTPSSDSALNLSWTDNSANEDEFLILRSTTENGTFTQIDTVSQNTSSFTDTSLDAGTTYYYRVIATNAGGNSAYTTGNGTTFTQLEAWRLNYFGSTANTGDAADSFDQDSDTLTNIVEYGLGTDPTSSTTGDGSAASPTATVEADGASSYLTLSVPRTSKRTDITYQVKVSGDLFIWSTDVTILSDTSTLLKVRDNTPISADQRFIRLEVTAP